MSTFMTGARRVGRIDQNNGDALALGFVKEERSELGKTPAMEGTALFFAVLASVSNVGRGLRGTNTSPELAGKPEWRLQ